MPLLYTQRGFRKAIAKNDAALVARYLAKTPVKQWLDAPLDERSSNSLHIAAQFGSKEVAEILLKAGANIEHPNTRGITPLGLATISKSQSVLELLIEKGANLEAATPDGNLLMTAVKKNFESGALYLLDKNPSLASGDALREAVTRNHKELAQKLLQAGMFDEADRKNPPLLHLTAATDDFAIARILLKHGEDNGKPLDINAQDIQGNTPLHLATEAHWNREMIRLLIDNGARPDIKNNAGKTPRNLALRYGSTETSRIFLDAADRQKARNATPLTAEAGHMPDDSAEEWVMMGAHQVARVGLYPATSRRLTHIFNFESRERIIISENLKTGAENITQPEKFDTLEKAHIAAALEAYRRLGGKATDEDVFGARMTKKHITGPGGQ